MADLQIVNWNIERQAPDKRRAKIMMERISAISPQLVCLTEAFEGSTAALGGYEISTRGVAWSKEAPAERKVVLWSRNPWTDKDNDEAETLRSGAYVAATTDTPIGAVRVIGVCIPYSFASPFGLTPRSRPWSEQLKFLEGLKQVVANREFAIPVVVIGDFNQFAPRIWGSKAASAALEEALGSLTICTIGIIDSINRPTVDHVALSQNLKAQSITGIDEFDDNGRKLSDHFGLAVRVSTATPR